MRGAQAHSLIHEVVEVERRNSKPHGLPTLEHAERHVHPIVYFDEHADPHNRPSRRRRHDCRAVGERQISRALGAKAV